MFSLLFDTSFWYDVLTTVAIVAIIWVCIKYPNGRIVILTILGALYIGFTIYCGISLNNYLSASGGIFGTLDNMIHPNQVEIVDEMKFNFKNTVLTQQGPENTYAARFMDESYLVVDASSDYMVFINGAPCDTVINDKDYIVATYKYNFLSEDFQVKFTDTLTLRFVFDTNRTALTVSTTGGSEAAKYWNDYFNRNVFMVECKRAEKYIPNDTMEIVHKVEFIFDDDILSTQFVKLGDCAKDFFIKGLQGWSLEANNAEKIINLADLKINHDTQLYAIIDPNTEFIVTFQGVDGNRLVKFNELIDEVPVTDDLISDNLYKVFKGWSINGVDLIDFAEFKIRKDIEFVPVYETSANGSYNINLKYTLTAGSGALTRDCTINFVYYNGLIDGSIIYKYDDTVGSNNIHKVRSGTFYQFVDNLDVKIKIQFSPLFPEYSQQGSYFTLKYDNEKNTFDFLTSNDVISQTGSFTRTVDRNVMHSYDRRNQMSLYLFEKIVTRYSGNEELLECLKDKSFHCTLITDDDSDMKEVQLGLRYSCFNTSHTHEYSAQDSSKGSLNYYTSDNCYEKAKNLVSYYNNSASEDWSFETFKSMVDELLNLGYDDYRELFGTY